MVTIDSQVLVFPLLSVTVNVTMLSPSSSHVKESCDNENSAIPQLSEDPSLRSSTKILATPFSSNSISMTDGQTTIGSILSTTVTVDVHTTLSGPLLTDKSTRISPISSHLNVRLDSKSPLKESKSLRQLSPGPPISEGKRRKTPSSFNSAIKS